MKFEEYEKVSAELWHLSLELYYNGINVGDEVSNIYFKFSMNYENEDKEFYVKLIKDWKMKIGSLGEHVSDK